MLNICNRVVVMVLCFLSLATGGLHILGAPSGQEQKWDPDAIEKQVKETSPRIFDTVHCREAEPQAVKAFSGCWRIVAAEGEPTDEELKLGMRLSQEKAQLLIKSYGATQFANSNNPRYCILDGDPTVAPYPNADFSKMYTYVYVLREIDQILEPIEKGVAERDKELTDEQRARAREKIRVMKDFSQRGGKYIQTLIVMGRERVWWDGDGEEDFWALPVSCEGWEEIEEQLKRSADAPAPGALIPEPAERQAKPPKRPN